MKRPSEAGTQHVTQPLPELISRSHIASDGQEGEQSGPEALLSEVGTYSRVQGNQDSPCIRTTIRHCKSFSRRLADEARAAAGQAPAVRASRRARQTFGAAPFASQLDRYPRQAVAVLLGVGPGHFWLVPPDNSPVPQPAASFTTSTAHSLAVLFAISSARTVREPMVQPARCPPAAWVPEVCGSVDRMQRSRRLPRGQRGPARVILIYSAGPKSRSSGTWRCRTSNPHMPDQNSLRATARVVQPDRRLPSAQTPRASATGRRTEYRARRTSF